MTIRTNHKNQQQHKLIFLNVENNNFQLSIAYIYSMIGKIVFILDIKVFDLKLQRKVEQPTS